MKVFKKIFFGLLSLILFLFILIYFLVTTNFGLNIILYNIEKWIPNFKISSVEGNLNNFAINDLYYKDPAIEINIKKIIFSTNLKYFFKKKITFDKIKIYDSFIRRNGEDIFSIQKKSNFLLEKIMESFSFFLNLLDIENLKLESEKSKIHLEKFKSRISYKEKFLTIYPTYIKNISISILDRDIEKKIRQENNFSYVQTTFSKIENFFIKNKNIENKYFSYFPSNILIKELKIKNLKIKKNQTYLRIIDLSLINISFIEKILVLEKIEFFFKKNYFDISGNLSLTKEYPILLKINIKSNFLKLKEKKVNLIFNGNLKKGYFLNTNYLNENKKKIILKTFFIIENSFKIFSFRGDISYIPLLNSTFEIKNLYFLLKKKEKKLFFSTKIFFSKQKTLPLYLNINVNLITGTFILSLLKTNSTILTINSNLIINNNDIYLRNYFFIKRINKIYNCKNFPDQLKGKIFFFGKYKNKKIELKIFKLSLNGKNSKNFFIKLNLIRNNDKKDIFSYFSYSSNSNKIDIEGKIINFIFLNKKIETKKVRNIFIFPNYLTFAKSKFDFKINNARWKNISINKIYLKGDCEYNYYVYKKVKINISMYKKKNKTINFLNLNFFGNKEKQTIFIKIKNKFFFGTIYLNGLFDYKNKKWCGNFNKFFFSNMHYKKNFAIKKNNLKEINNEKDTLIQSTKINLRMLDYINFLFKESNFSSYQSLLMNTKIQTLLEGKVNIFWNSYIKLPKIKIFIFNKKTIIFYTDNKLNFIQKLEKLNLNFSIFEDHAKINWFLAFNKNSQLNGFLKINFFEERNKIYGNIDIKNISFSKKNISINKEDDLRINAKIHFIKNNYYPEIYGRIDLENIIDYYYDFPSKIDKDRIILFFKGVKLNFFGMIQKKYEIINLSGLLNWNNLNKLYVTLKIKGNQINKKLSIKYPIDIDCKIFIESNPNHRVIKGNIDIFQANIKIEEIPKNDMDISKDIVIVDNNLKLQKKIKSEKSITNIIDLSINIHKNVYLKFFGIKSKLIGFIKIKKENNQDFNIDGQIYTYEIQPQYFWKNLNFKKKQFLFLGSLDEIYLNFEAINRKIVFNNKSNLVMKLTGSLNKPQILIFPEILKNNEEFLTYLPSNKKENISLINKIITYIFLIGIIKNEYIIEKINPVFGINNILLEIEEVVDESNIIISSDFGKNLNVKYSFGIFKLFNSLILQYKLMSKPLICLESNIGLSKIINLLFKVEF